MANKLISIDVKGLADLERALADLPNKIERAVLLKALRAGARPIVKAAKAAAPRDTGTLRRNIAVRTVPKRASGGGAAIHVGPLNKIVMTAKGPRNPAKYAHLVEFGAARHRITAINAGGPARVLAIGPLVIGTSVDHPGAAAQPFLRPAYEQNRVRAAKLIGERLGLEVEKAAAKLAAGGRSGGRR